ncbi:MAG: hypothetical protein E7262_10035 [Lachnospiraceae bacterium]|nr:hypothetical protein [Lachnospiraceae bacterium]
MKKLVNIKTILGIISALVMILAISSVSYANSDVKAVSDSVAITNSETAVETVDEQGNKVLETASEAGEADDMTPKTYDAFNWISIIGIIGSSIALFVTRIHEKRKYYYR